MHDHIEVLEFNNPVFRKGINVTVRNGDKWRDRVEIGDRVMAKIDENRSRTAVIDGVLYANFHSIPAPVHALNHDPDCRTTAGIANELHNIYGPFPMGVIGGVTVLFFHFDEPDA